MNFHNILKSNKIESSVVISFDASIDKVTLSGFSDNIDDIDNRVILINTIDAIRVDVRPTPTFCLVITKNILNANVD